MAAYAQALLDGQRAFPEAQRLLAGTPASQTPLRLDVGWHGTDVDPLRWAFAVVGRDAGLGDLIGEVVQISAPGARRDVTGEPLLLSDDLLLGDDTLLGDSLTVVDRRSLFVLVVGARSVPVPLSLTRRAFLALGRLTHESLPCRVEVVQ